MENKIKIIFFGDLALVKGLVKPILDEHIFGDVPKLLESVDLVVGNLESPHPGKGLKNYSKIPYVIADHEMFSQLVDLKLDILNLANNHIFDAFESGYIETANFLMSANIAYIGAGLSSAEASRPVIKECNGIKIGFLSYAFSDTNPRIHEHVNGFINMFSLPTVIKDIQILKKEIDFCVVLLHWGVDYCRFPSPQQREVAFALSQIGTNMIVGTHTHTIQTVEKINGTLVAYGLGNFYFPDFMQSDGIRIWDRRAKESLLLEVTIEKDRIESVNYHRTVQNGVNITLRSRGIHGYVQRLKIISYLLKSNMLWICYLIFRKKKELVQRYLSKRERNWIVQVLSLRPGHVRQFFMLRK